MQWESMDLTGNIYYYGFNGWDGSHPSTCTLGTVGQLDGADHYTAFSHAAFKKDDICSIVYRVWNTAKAPQTAIFVTLAAQ